MSLPENSKTKLPVSSSSSAPSSYLTLKSHLLLMNAPSTSKPNRYKRSHSSISNPESRIKGVVEKDKISTEKSSKSDNSKGNTRKYLILIFLISTAWVFLQLHYIFIIPTDDKKDISSLLSKDCVAALMAQMSAAAANPLVLPPSMMPSSSEIMHQAMWLSRAQQLLEEQQKNLKRDGIEDSMDLSTNTNTHGQRMN